MEPPRNDPALGPLANKLRSLRYLKGKQGGEQFDISEIADEVSRLYVEDKIFTARNDLVQAGATDDQINTAIDAICARRPLLNRQYLSDLLSGKRRNPTKDILEYLALFLGVSPVYFFEGASRTETEDAEDEIAMLVAAIRLYRTLKQSGQKNAGELLTAFMEGSNELSPDTVAGMLHMQLAAVSLAKDEDLEPDQVQEAGPESSLGRHRHASASREGFGEHDTRGRVPQAGPRSLPRPQKRAPSRIGGEGLSSIS
ncbi:hypothetical protein [Streptomyces sp. NPDC088727]|uniref:hypothetical protein n=1 Tax=Streptomyces sp. NPDC088727 TaxID=3365875 RepID=UPI003830C111